MEGSSSSKLRRRGRGGGGSEAFQVLQQIRKGHQQQPQSGRALFPLNPKAAE